MGQILHAHSLSLKIDEVKVDRSAPLAGKSLAESDFRQQFDAVVIGIIDSDTREMTFNPTASTRINAGDILIVLGDADVIQTLREQVCTA
jgi:voltage-gated potassium channel